METLEAIIIAIIFFAPGFIYNHAKRRIFPRTLRSISDFELTVNSIINSTVILFINIILIRYLYNPFAVYFKWSKEITINNIENLQTYLGNVNFFIAYFILTIIVCIVYAIVNQLFIRKIIDFFINKKRVLFGETEESDFSSVWDEIFENKNNSLSDKYIEIKKDGETITQGLIKLYPNPNARKEFLLMETEEFKAFLENDKELKRQGKEPIFDVIDDEYYDFETGTLIKFYSSDKLKQYINSSTAN